MASTFRLEMVTPEKQVFSEMVQSVRAPGVMGSFGVMAGHAPMLAELETGLIKLTLADGREAFIATSGGFLQVTREKVLVLADSAELSEEIDVDRARQAAEKARQALSAPGVNAEEVRRELDRALNRVRIAQMKS
jgi:F-type H+-transporting ATPase subunit epsilon